jgi:flagellar hook assembly protein FlgD/lysophospholipase L1-like esterase
MRVQLRRALALLLSTVLIVVALGTATALAVSRIQLNTSATTFSPNGDGQEDTYSLAFSLDYPGNVSAWIADSADAKIATLAEDQSMSSGYHYLTWDGHVDGGFIASDGFYTVHVKAVDRDALPMESTVQVAIDSRVPAKLVSPPPGSTLDGLVDLVVAPTPGFTLTGVSFQLPRCSWWVVTPEADGSFAQRQADVTRCGVGTVNLQASIYWTDQFSAQHGYSTSAAETIVDTTPPVMQPAGGSSTQRTIYRNSPSTLEGANLQASASDASELTWSWTLKNAAGDTITPLTANGNYGSSYSSFINWYGTDAAGAPLPDGTYTITATAADQGGLSASLDYLVTIDSRIPAGLVVAPGAGTTVGATADFVIRPNEGFAPSSGYVSLGRCSWSSWTRDEQGRFSWSQVDTSACGLGDQAVSWGVNWLDAQGNWHSYNDSSVHVTLVDTAPPVVSAGDYTSDRRILALASTNTRENLFFAARCIDSSPVSWVFQALDSQGQVVRTFSPRGSGCGSWGYDSYVYWDGTGDDGSALPDGDYVVRAAATDIGGLSAFHDFSVTLDTRVPAAVASPTAGDTLTGTVRLSVLPAATAGLTQAYFSLGRCSWTGVAQQDGSYTVEQADVTSCGVGDADLLAYAYYNDSLNSSHSFTTIVPVKLVDATPPVITVNPSYDNQVMAPSSPGQLENRGFYARCSDVSTVTWAFEVQDSQGNLVRRLQPWTYYNGCNNYYEDAGASWDGKDEWGTQAPDGPYKVHLTATDAGGLQSSADLSMTVDSRVPGALSTPAPGSVLTGRQRFDYTPAGDFATTTLVSAYFAGVGIPVYNASPDGIWRTTYPMGGLPAGASVLYWQVQWLDSHGGVHNFSGAPRDVAIDPTSLSLDASLDQTSGQVPFTAQLTVRASDPNDAPVKVKVDWGDGSTQTLDFASPYDPKTLSHDFTTAGSFNVVLTASNGAAGFASKTIPVSIAGAPNSAPTLTLGVSQTSGVAPFNSSLTLAANDPDGDALSTRVDFGDGTPAVTGAFNAAPIAHVYSAPGTYLVRAQVSDGKATSAAFVRITVGLSEPLRAMAGDDVKGVVGASLVFDASASMPAVAIGSYSWNFGDGTTASGSHVEHTYSVAGAFKAVLTVTSGQQTNTDEAKVVIEAPPPAKGLTVDVTSGGSAVPNATAMIVLPDGSRVQQATDGSGAAFLAGLADGQYAVYVLATGYKPATGTATVIEGIGKLDVVLETGALAAATLESHPMTYQEVVDAGISVADPTNYHVYEATINLYFEPQQADAQPVSLPVYVTGETVICQSNCPVPVTQTSDGPIFTITDSSGTAPVTYQYLPKVIYVADQPIIQWLVIPMRASFLKEFFEVRMIVQNLTTGFTFQQGNATLSLPSGLSLAPTADNQSLSQPVSDTASGSSSTVTWVVRGDTEGGYSLSADYTGSVEPVGIPVRISASTQTPLKVWGASALQTTIYVDDKAERWAPYNIDVEIRNVTAKEGQPGVSVYNAQVEMLDRAPDAPATAAPYIYAPGLPQVQGTAEIKPGGTLVAHYTIFPGIGSEKTQDLIFELKNQFMVRTGGDVDLAPAIVPRSSQSGGKIWPIKVDVVKSTSGDDQALLSWARPDPTVASYQLYTRQTLNRPGLWAFRSNAALSGLQMDGVPAVDLAAIPASDRSVGRYYALATVYTDGTVRYQHSIGVGPARYVALGDSYSSGEGVPGFEPGTAKDVSPTGQDGDNVCHRSQAGSYSRLLGEDPAYEGLLTPVDYGACSGAVTQDVLQTNKANPSEAAQDSRVNEFTDLITISIGGNDIGFGDIAQACVIWDCSAKIALNDVVGSNAFLDTAASMWDKASPIMDALEACANPVDMPSKLWCAYQAKKAIDVATEDPDRISTPRNLYNGTLHDRLVKVYRDLATRAPHSQIVVMKYPLITDTENLGSSCSLYTSLPLDLSGSERAEIYWLTQKLNEEVERAVADSNAALGGHRIITVDPNKSFGDHTLCKSGVSNPESYTNTIVSPLLSTAGNNGPIMYSFHPNALGHQAMKVAITSQVNSLSGMVTQGQTLSLGTSFVPYGARTFRAEATWPGSTVGLTLVSPSGQVFSAGDAGVRSGSTATTAWLEVDSPGYGQWTVKVAGVDVRPEGEPVQVTTATAAASPPSPVAAVTTTPSDTDPRTFTLDASGSTASQGSLSFSWLFSDGTTTVGDRVEHTFTNDGPMWASVQVSDGVSDPTFSPVELGTAPKAPTFVPPSLAPVAAGTSLSIHLTAQGYPAPQFALASGLLPNGVTIDAAGLLSGTAADAGEYVFSVSVTNSYGTVTSTPITLLVQGQPALTAQVPTPAVVGQAYEYAFAASGFPVPVFALASGTLPDGLSLSEDGHLAGTPVRAGSYTFTVSAANGVGSVETAPITLVVQSAPVLDTVPPIVTGTVSPASQTGWYRAPVTVTWSVTDPEPSSGGVTTPDAIAVSTEGKDQAVTSRQACDAAGNCATGTVTVSLDLTAPTVVASLVDASSPADGSKVVHFTCADALSGVASCSADVPIRSNMTTPVTGLVSDNAGNTATTTIEVSAPAFTSGAPAGTASVGTPYSFAFTATGIPLPTIGIAQGALPVGLTLETTGELTGTPTTAGTYTFSVVATSRTGMAMTGPYQIVVLPAAPAALTITSTSLPGGFVGRPYSGTVSALGGKVPYTWAIKGKVPAGLSLDAATGILQGIPTAAGKYDLSVTVTDASSPRQAASTSVTLVISDPPIQVSPVKLVKAKVGRTYVVTFVATGGRGPYLYGLEGATNVDGLTLATDGTLSGKPTAQGSFAFTVRVTDADGAVGWRQYALTVG